MCTCKCYALFESIVLLENSKKNVNDCFEIFLLAGEQKKKSKYQSVNCVNDVVIN